MNRAAFYAELRKRSSGVFGTSLGQKQVEGMEAILDEAERAGTPLAWLAYMLATAYHETAATMQPIAEYGRGRGRKYGKPAGPYGHAYYGRGLVQLTWLANYKRASQEIGVDFVKHPDRAMETPLAVRIMFAGMEEGWFTGRKLADYMPAGGAPKYVGARRIINGTDKANKIAGHAETFERALKAAGYGSAQAPAEKAGQVELLAFGSNDWGKPEVAVDALQQAVANARARGRKPVFVPGKTTSTMHQGRVAWVAELTRKYADINDIDIEHVTKWRSDDLHPTFAEFKRIAKKYPDAIVRGDSFAEGIIVYGGLSREAPNIMLPGKSAAVVLDAIAKIDGGLKVPDEDTAKPGPSKPEPPARQNLLSALIGLILELFGKEKS